MRAIWLINASFELYFKELIDAQKGAGHRPLGMALAMPQILPLREKCGIE